MSSDRPEADPPPQPNEKTQLPSSKSFDEQPDAREMPCFWRFFGVLVRIYGYLTVAALGICSWRLITDKENYPYTSWYTVAVTIFIGLIELIWILSFCAICRDEGGLCCTCWRLFIWIDDWRKTILFIALSIPEFTIDKPAVVPYVAGVLIIILGILYFFKSFVTCYVDSHFRSAPISRDRLPSTRTTGTMDKSTDPADMANGSSDKDTAPIIEKSGHEQ